MTRIQYDESAIHRDKGQQLEPISIEAVLIRDAEIIVRQLRENIYMCVYLCKT
jgi:hypothetical protein